MNRIIKVDTTVLQKLDGLISILYIMLFLITMLIFFFLLAQILNSIVKRKGKKIEVVSMGFTKVFKPCKKTLHLLFYYTADCKYIFILIITKFKKREKK
jgi:hypothetical protein